MGDGYINTVLRHGLFRLHFDIRGGKTERPSALVADNHLAFQVKMPAKHFFHLIDLAFRQQLPDSAAANNIASQFSRFDHFDAET